MCIRDRAGAQRGLWLRRAQSPVARPGLGRPGRTFLLDGTGLSRSGGVEHRRHEMEEIHLPPLLLKRRHLRLPGTVLRRMCRSCQVFRPRGVSPPMRTGPAAKIHLERLKLTVVLLLPVTAIADQRPSCKNQRNRLRKFRNGGDDRPMLQPHVDITNEPLAQSLHALTAIFYIAIRRFVGATHLAMASGKK